MTTNWVDFKAIKQAVTIEQVLAHYQVNWLRKSGEELRGRCPIHKGEGQDTFHANTAKNNFNCFSCRKHGNVLDLVAAMEKCSVRDAALKLAEWFSISVPEQHSKGKMPAKKAEPEEPPASAGGESTAVNKPLSFQLKNIDHTHPYLEQRGITKGTAENFAVGFFSGKGSMTGRIVIPIHNERGELLAYAGRSIDSSEPRYKLPAGFHKSLELFNLHSVLEETSTDAVVVVEGFFDCMKVAQAGHLCVALMGSSLSEAQQALLCRHFRKVMLLLDGDEAGKKATDDCLLRLGRRLWVTAIVLPDGKQPDMLTVDELRALLAVK